MKSFIRTETDDIPTISKFTFKILRKHIVNEQDFEKSIKKLKNSVVTYHSFVQYQDYNREDMFCVDYYLMNSNGYMRIIPFTFFNYVNLENKLWVIIPNKHENFYIRIQINIVQNLGVKTILGLRFITQNIFQSRETIVFKSNRMGEFMDTHNTEEFTKKAFPLMVSRYKNFSTISQVMEIVSKFIAFYMTESLVPFNKEAVMFRLVYMFGVRPEHLSRILDKSNRNKLKTKVMIFKTSLKKIFLNIEYNSY
ncbi:hypothetical protein RF11_07653 [Thelohanellus kitauei]|uniref:Uncharacterized protein n=1 Tax=Thelohanellus kitauei TaxID=669202 RepID=A0A0C2MSZ8_THEKT|nr:hypothetical protein RF11_07653 [Thelohanellus kitauei]